MIRLNMTRGDATEERIFSGSVVTVGRSSQCDVTVKGLGCLSRRHCEISILDNHCEIVDCSSRNGVEVNGIFVKRAVVEVGDEIRLGELLLELVQFGPDDRNPEEIRPCLECGYLMAVKESSCPRCSGAVRQPRDETIAPNRIMGYVLRRKIGSGGMGMVFEAVRTSDMKTTAIKILKPHLAENPSYFVRFVEETRALTLLKHPGIVQIHGRGAEKGLAYIDMELVSGRSVRELIHRERALGEEKCLRIIWQMARALDYAAGKKIIHGDVKPSNFLEDSSSRYKLCDFGLARFRDLSREMSYPPESSNRRGTAAYAAPERFLSGARPTVASDIYSLGASLFQMLSGELPFGNNRRAKARSSAFEREGIPDLVSMKPGVRQATSMLVRRMMETDLGRRYGDYPALLDDLGLLL